MKLMRLEIVCKLLLKVSPDTLTSYVNFMLLVGQNLAKFKINVLTKLVISVMVYLTMQHV